MNDRPNLMFKFFVKPLAYLFTALFTLLARCKVYVVRPKAVVSGARRHKTSWWV